MAAQHRSTTATNAKPWGTPEELLLACAVNRHGPNAWDSIVIELQTRTSSVPLTSQACQDKFNDLKRRFTPQNETASIVDELRKIRVEELKREVQRCDVSIKSLEMKVKKLEEDREKSVKKEKETAVEGKPSAETIAGKSSADAGGDRDDKEDRSYNESNSTSQQQEAKTATVKQQNDAGDIKLEPELEMDPVRSRPERDWSANGKVEEDKNDDENGRIGKEIIKMRPSHAAGSGESTDELGESVGESKKEDKEKGNQNSDMQSSASLSKKRKEQHRTLGSSSGEEEPDGGDEVSPATKSSPTVKSEPLLKLLEIMRSHRLDSAFGRRLPSQESERYKNLIRQHIDVQMIQSRLDRGLYSTCVQNFFRDLLLCLNNAIVFFSKRSPEYLAACAVRTIVCKEMTEMNKKYILKPHPLVVKTEPKQLVVSLSKPNKSASSTLVACGKRSSIKTASEAASRKGSKKDGEVEEKPNVTEKETESALAQIEDKGIRKKRTKERSVSSRRNSRTSNNKIGEIKHQYGGNELSSHDALEIKVDKKESTVRKRQGAASFLKRMKQNSPSDVTENFEDDPSEDESKDAKVKEEKKGGRGRNKEVMRGRITRSSRGRGSREESGNAKRIGRPPKRQEASQLKSGGRTGKRGRDNGDPGTAGRAGKRSRR